MDFSCYILSQPRPTLPSHPSVTTQVQQQIESLCSRQQIQTQKPTAIIPPAQSVGGWAERNTDMGWGGWGFTADLCFNAEVGGSSGGG